MQPGWLDPSRGQLPPTSPFALFSNGGERETKTERQREPGIYTFFPRSTPQRKRQNGKVSGVVAIFLVSAYVLIVYATTMNILFSLLAYSCVQSENERKTEQYSARESAVVGVDPTFYIRIDYSYKRLRDTIYRSNCVAKTSRLEWTHLS